MMTSSNGNIFRVTGILCGEFTGPGEFPAQRPVTRSFDAYFDLRLNKRLSKQSWGWWSETPSSSLWRHRNIYHFFLWIEQQDFHWQQNRWLSARLKHHQHASNGDTTVLHLAFDMLASVDNWNSQQILWLGTGFKSGFRSRWTERPRPPVGTVLFTMLQMTLLAYVTVMVVMIMKNHWIETNVQNNRQCIAKYHDT